MNLRIELRGAVLISLLMLLWLSFECIVGLQTEYIAYHPYVGMLSLLIPVFVTRQSLMAKRDELRNGFTFGKAFLSGSIIAVFAAVMAIPVQLAFHYFVNPDFFDDMIAYSVKHGQDPGRAASYFNLNSYLFQSVAATLVVGFIISAVAAFFMQVKTEK